MLGPCEEAVAWDSLLVSARLKLKNASHPPMWVKRYTRTLAYQHQHHNPYRRETVSQLRYGGMYSEIWRHVLSEGSIVVGLVCRAKVD